MEKKTVGSFIAALRKSNGMTQRELADRLSVSNKTVSKWECDDGYPELALIPVIAEIFNVTSDEILQGRRISKEELSEKSVIKTDQQINRLIKSTLSKYKIAIYIAGGVSLVGLNLLFVIAYSVFRPYIGLSILVLFILASFIVAIFHLLQAKKAIDISEMTKEDDKRIIETNLIIEKYFFNLIVLNVFLAIIGFPIGLMGDAYSVVTFTYYANNVLPYLILYMIPLFFILYIIYHSRVQNQRFKIELENNLKVKSLLKKLNIICPIVSWVLMSTIFPLFYISFNSSFYIFPLLVLITCIIYFVLRKKIIKRL